MIAYKIFFTITQIIFIALAILAIAGNKNSIERHQSFWYVTLYILFTSIGCTVGMWL